MTDTQGPALAVLLVSLVLIAAVLSNRLSQWIRIPVPALFLIAASAAAALFPALSTVSFATDQQIVSVALVVVLFDGGMHIGWRRFRAVAGAVTLLGIVGTLLTSIAVAMLAHFLFGFDWQLSLLLGAALSPTDPAVVFSVLGKREIQGRSGTILEGESGANDPVGIALMVSLLGATGGGLDALGSGLGEFALQLGVGVAIGIGGGLALLWIIRRASLPSEALYSVQALAGAGVIYGATTLLSGSGFLAVLLAGILIGDARAPFKREIERFTGGIASIAEITVFVVLGLSVRLDVVFRPDVLWVGLGIAALLALVVRPLLVGLTVLPVKLRWGERAFVLWAGLKGAVPILLGVFIVTAHVAGATRLYGIIYVVVLASVIVQGGLVPAAARLFRVPMRTVEPRPWATGLRLGEQPSDLHQHVVAAGSPADGRSIAELDLGEDGWISLVTRGGKLVQVRGSTRFEPGDVVLALGSPSRPFAELFGEL